MKKYYLPAKNGFKEEVSYEEWLSFTGEEQDRPYIKKLYINAITIEEVPADRRENVQTIVNNRISRCGEYQSQIMPANELKTLVDAFYKKQLTRAEAIKLFESLEKMRNLVPDSVASETVDAYLKLKEDGQLINVGTRINWNGKIKRAMVNLWDTVANNPDNAPALWEDINYKEGHRLIPEVITASAAFSKGELGWWKDELYESLLDSNVWTPDAYPAGWELLQ